MLILTAADNINVCPSSTHNPYKIKIKQEKTNKQGKANPPTKSFIQRKNCPSIVCYINYNFRLFTAKFNEKPL